MVVLACSLLLIKINPTLGPRWKSFLIALPLVFSLAAALLYLPTVCVDPPSDNESDLNLMPGKDRLIPQGISSIDTMMLPAAPTAERYLSITGLLVMLGISMGALSLILSLALGDRLARRLLKVVELTPEDWPELWEDVRNLASSLGVRVPMVGLVEDLRPNAFTFGWGKRTTIVFSLGILQLLDRIELKAVTAHELAHVKNRDAWFRTTIGALAWVHFFDPTSHLSVRAAQRERERFADETACSALGEQDSLQRALEKVVSFSGEGVHGGLATRIGLCFALSFLDRNPLMSQHPPITERTRPSRKRVNRRSSPLTCLVLSVAVLLIAAVAFVGLGHVRDEIQHLGTGDGMGTVPMYVHHSSTYQQEGISMRGEIEPTGPILVHGPLIPFDLCNNTL